MAKLRELLTDADIIDFKGNMDEEITSVTFDSRRCGQGTLFVCIEGFSNDGHKFIPDAVAAGTRAFLVSRDVDVPDGITVVRVADCRDAMAAVSCRLYGNPTGSMTLLGITGTKGKTTTAFIYWNILNSLGRRAGMIGTLGNFVGRDKVNTGRSTPTTPESCDLQYSFRYMLDSGVSDAVMEVTSQALKLSRVAYTDYDTAIFMNLTRDHITEREHPDMEDYFLSKAKLFGMCRQAIINSDSDYGRRLMGMVSVPVYTMSLRDGDIHPEDIRTSHEGMTFRLVTPWGQAEVQTNLQGQFNIYNIMAAVSGACLAGIKIEDAVSAVRYIYVPGRLEEVELDTPYKVLIDYAHTPDSLENVLRALKSDTEGRVISVFGCGGDRDHGKRPQMGRISCSIADISVITSDNPRTENPDSIIDMIVGGARGNEDRYVRITDRRQAIKYACSIARPGDVVLLAGKGQETYQMFGDRTIPFDERVVAREVVEELKSEN